MKKAPKKSLGQNFLRDPKIIKKIFEASKIEKNDLVFEVGPGEGTLTSFLIQQTQKTIAIEKDDFLSEELRGKFEEEIKKDKLEIINADVLTLASFEQTTDYKIIGNIPYYITGALFRKIFELDKLPKSITFVIQKEVAERIVAKNQKESLLSISIKAYGEPKIINIIKAGSFFPKPKVDSAILVVENINRQKFLTLDLSEKKFFEILRAGFGHKRKFLLKNLLNSKITNKISDLEKIFEEIDIPKKVRAEDLAVADWLKLVKKIESC